MKKLIFIAVIPLLLMNCGITPFVFSTNCNNDYTEIYATTGQELVDLKHALDSGSITQDEYDKIKKNIMEKFDAPVDSIETNYP